MFGRLHARDRRLIYLLCLIAATLFGSSWFGAQEAETYMIRQQAREEVFNWTRFVEYRLQDINRILMYGRVAQEDQDIIQLMSDAENVLRYRFFNRAGFVVLSSIPGEVGQRDVNTYFSDLVADGQTFVKLQADGQFASLEPDRHGGDVAPGEAAADSGDELIRGSVIAEAYRPVMLDGRLNGVIEVHINVTSTALLVRRIMAVARSVLIGIILLVGGATFMVVRNNIRDRNRELEEMRQAHEAAELAEEKVLELNAVLEQRVIERTAELKEVQEQYLRRERLAALGQLTATVSHELRNPLGAVRNTLFAISARIKDKGLGVEGSLQRAERAIIRCNNIITEMLDFVRESALELAPTNFDRWLAQLISEQPVPEGVSLHTDLDAAGVELGLDSEQLRRAVLNVIQNANQAMTEQAEDGTAPASGPMTLTISSRLAADRLELAVTDTGPGIPADKMEKIFEPLFSTKAFGVGLGLPLVQQIMARHGGGIDVRSDVGAGTTMVLWLPLAEPAEQAA